MKPLPRLRTVLMLTYLIALAAPLAGLWLMRLYESALIRQTEQELFAQAAVLAAVYRADLRVESGQPALAPTTGPGPSLSSLGLALARRPGLDLARDAVLPPPPDPVQASPEDAPDADALRAGAAMTPLLAEAQGVTFAALRMVDARGVIVSSTGGDLGKSVAAWPEVANALRGGLASTIRRREPPTPPVRDIMLARDDGLRVFVAFPVLQDERAIGAVLLSRTPRTLFQAMWGKRYALLLIAMLLLTSVAALALAATRLIARPMLHVVHQAQRIARGESQSVELPPYPGTRETADLAAAIARMAQTLAERADYLRSFAASVSHEFKTPLAAMAGAAELLVDHDATMSPAERAHFAATISAGVQRLNLLVRRLLDLARADLTQCHGATDVMPAVSRAARKAATLRVTIAEAPALRAAVRPEALDLILDTLLENVRVHAGETAQAFINVGTDGDAVTITVSDDGPGISPDNAARVFETFFTTARDRGGTGLGLAIVAALARGANGTVTLVPRPAGASFRLTLPCAWC